MARAGVDNLLYLAEGATQLRNFQKQAIEQVQLRETLKSYGGKPVQEVLDLVKSWENIVE